MDTSSFIFVFFGATGDLAVKKIFPVLEALFKEGNFGRDSKIIAISRRDWNDGEFKDFIKKSSNISSEEFLNNISYSKIDLEKGAGYAELKAKITSLKKPQRGSQKPEVLFYTALAPVHQEMAIKSLKKAHMLDSGKNRGKILLEKPFGTDQKTACKLDRLLASFLDESQIYRIDHYFGKDVVEALMKLHESTPSFSQLLSSENVKSIRIRLFEEKGIDGRGASYDHVGAFRDVGQNHMLEMLAVVAAELPRESSGTHGATEWQFLRAAVLKHLAPPAKTCALSRRGQYEGYENEAGVRTDSETETAFEVTTTLAKGKLAHVPLILESGKKMLASEVFIEINFKEIQGLPKKMTFSVQPNQEIITENVDGTKDIFEIPKTRDAYGNVMLAAFRGSRREFAGSAEIEALWGYADHVVACWGVVPLEIYSPDKPFLLQ